MHDLTNRRNQRTNTERKGQIEESRDEYYRGKCKDFSQGLPTFPSVNLLKPTGHVMHRQFNIQQLYVLPTLYLCVLYLSENKQRLVPLTA